MFLQPDLVVDSFEHIQVGDRNDIVLSQLLAEVSNGGNLRA